MDIKEAIKGRISVRAFQDKPVAKEVIYDVLDTARWAPSGTNTQPWKVVVAQGKTKQTISDALLNAAKNGVKANPDYQYYPKEWVEPFKGRRFQCGMDLYQALDIGREDKEKRTEAALANYRFFDAPVSIFFFIDKIMAQGSWFDMGMFVQSVMLALRGHGLGSCPQASTSDYPDLVRESLNVSDQYSFICSLSVGYPDNDKAVNQYRTQREDVDSFTTWAD
ncbi:nitroreductase [Cycloclasticus sp. P1]|jgi:nitroreductase|uniref:nitroreductase n=1 Tax=Cycloclasticus sp. (strain P1) TaxID=385025 RepID=UPI000286A8DB|nr:nitroreductase [Cycloclasticus sp. P1]AFT67235.1 Nitroreductase family protein [Cycloclasticus sp. P1]